MQGMRQTDTQTDKCREILRGYLYLVPKGRAGRRGVIFVFCFDVNRATCPDCVRKK